MSLLWIEGFEGFGGSAGSNPSGLAAKYPRISTVGESNYTLRAGRLGGLGLEFSGTTEPFFATPGISASPLTMVVGFGFKQASYSATSPNIITFRKGATTMCILRVLVTSGEWRALDSAGLTLGTTSGATITAGQWGYVEAEVFFATSGGGTFKVWVNGTQYLNLSGVTTANGAAVGSGCDNVLFTGSTDGTIDTTLDDIYVLDTSGSVNNARLGSQVVRAFYPSADTTAEDWTRSAGSDSFALVDENPSNGDTDYIQSSTSGHTTRFTMGPVEGVARIKGVQINTRCRETDANPFSIYQQVKSGATTSDGTAVGIGSVDYITRNRIVETDPNTGNLWTVANINAAEFGIKLV